ncbi:MAG: hypothetical protein BV457_05885 [Thermoplasmata archaeon M9B1D]|nr:MAG: hypothetical protein BV457_05885 [Thermoplasmata archaeon M9B1D]PNX51233.1 MAG: hypothetical protein BV456_04000 [Thermoplasmata archaeon M8B2D]
MLVFKNNEKGTYFFVDNKNGEVNFLTEKEFSVFYKFSHIFGGIEYLRLPDYKTVQQFRRIIKKGILKDVHHKDTKKVLMKEYPEFFI